MRSSRSARRVGLKLRIERGPRGGVSARPRKKAIRTTATISESRRVGTADYTSRMRALLAASIVFACLASLACGGITTPSSNTTDTFNGTLQPKDTKAHLFNVSKTGELTVKLTAWTPN